MARAASAGAACRRSTGGGGGPSGASDGQTGHREAWASPEEAESRTCPICLHVPRDAVAHSCGELFCELCWARLGTKPKCPSCRSDAQGALTAHRDRREVLNLMIYCPRGCKAEVRLGSKQAHLDEDCVRRPVSCPRCSSEVRADLLEDHTLRECLHREILCPDCGMSTTPHGLEEHQRESCPHRRVPCQLCGESVQWKDMNAHLTAEPGKHLAALIEENSGLRKRGAELESQILGLKQAEEGLRNEVSEMRKAEERFERQMRQLTEKLKESVKVVYCKVSYCKQFASAEKEYCSFHEINPHLR